MSNLVVAITGGNSGIGLAMTRMFLAKGYRVAVFSRSELRYSDIGQVTSGQCSHRKGQDVKQWEEQLFIYTGDVQSSSQLGQFYLQCQQKWGGIDTVVANAGVAVPEQIEEVTEQSFDQSVNVNVKGVFFTVQKSLPYLNKKASVILISSIQAQRGAGVWAVYGATKAAVRALARSFSQALGSRGIRVNTLSPGVTDTPILKKFGFSEAQLTDIVSQVSTSTPLGRIGDADEIAEAALFLASERASFITGADLQVDGGLAQI